MSLERLFGLESRCHAGVESRLHQRGRGVAQGFEQLDSITIRSILGPNPTAVPNPPSRFPLIEEADNIPYSIFTPLPPPAAPSFRSYEKVYTPSNPSGTVTLDGLIYTIPIFNTSEFTDLWHPDMRAFNWIPHSCWFRKFVEVDAQYGSETIACKQRYRFIQAASRNLPIPDRGFIGRGKVYAITDGAHGWDTNFGRPPGFFFESYAIETIQLVREINRTPGPDEWLEIEQDYIIDLGEDFLTDAYVGDLVFATHYERTDEWSARTGRFIN